MIEPTGSREGIRILRTAHWPFAVGRRFISSWTGLRGAQLPITPPLGGHPLQQSSLFTTLNSVGRPFHAVNHFGSWGGGTALTRRRSHAMMNRSIELLQRRLEARPRATFCIGCASPGLGPIFRDTMTLRGRGPLRARTFEIPPQSAHAPQSAGVIGRTPRSSRGYFRRFYVGALASAPSVLTGGP
jgi:hypothetical protein